MGKRPLSRDSSPSSDTEDLPPKPATTFNGALSHLVFTSKPLPSVRSLRATRSTSTLPNPIKRATTTTPSPSKKPRKKRTGYAPPSVYSHLSGIPDVFTPNLILVFVGTNPGLATARLGHAYSAPSNLFWKLLHQSGLTPDMRRPPTADTSLPELYSYGNTNLISRPTRDQAELSKTEMEEATPILESKMRRWKPEAMCIVGKGIWERIYKYKTGRVLGKGGDKFEFGWQDLRLGESEAERWEGTRVFVAVSTSGLVAGYSYEQKLALMKELAEWVAKRREEREETAPRGLPAEMIEKAARRREEEHRKELENAGVKMEDIDDAGVKIEDAGVKIEDAGVKIEDAADGVKVEAD